MISSRIGKATSVSALAALALAASGCSVSAEGAIPCFDDSNCPAPYPQCVGATNSAAGTCKVASGTTVGAATVSVVGIVGHGPDDIVAGPVRFQVTGKAGAGIKKLELAAGGTVIAPATDSVPPLYNFDVPAPTGTGDLTLTVSLTGGDDKVVTSTVYTLHYDNVAPALTLATPAPQSARPGSLVTVDVTADDKLASIAGTVTPASNADARGTLSLLSGVPGTDTAFKLGYTIPANASAGVFTFKVTGKDRAGNVSAEVSKQTTVYGGFAVSSFTVTSAGSEGSVAAGNANAAIHATATLPATVPLGPGAAVFSLVDAAGHGRNFGGTVNVSTAGAVTTLTISDSIAGADVDGVASLHLAVTDLAGNTAAGSTSLIVDNQRPFLNGFAPSAAAADSNTGTVTFTGRLGKAVPSAPTWKYTAGATGTGSCTCAAGGCVSGALVSCAVAVPLVSGSPATVSVAAVLADAVGNTSLDSSNGASFQDLPLPTSTGFSPPSTTIIAGGSASLTPSFQNGAATVSNDKDALVFAVTSGTAMVVKPAVTTTYTLTVLNALGSALSPAPTATVTVTAPLSFTAIYNPVSGSPTPGAMTSGASTGTLSFSIPTFVGFTPGTFTAQILGAGGTAVVHADNSAVTSAEIIAAQGGSVASVKIPATDPADVRSLTYTLRLTVSGTNSDSLASLQLIPQVALSGPTFAVAPGTITGGSVAALTVTLPRLSGSTAQTASLQDQFNGVPFKFGTTSPVTSDDLFAAQNGATLQIAPPTSTPTDATRTYNFTFKASNAANSAQQTSNLTIIPAVIAINSGNNQTAVQGTQLASPLVVKVTDNNNAAVSGVTVHWAAVTGGTGVAVGSATSVTDSGGLAQTTATLGSAGGANTFTATVVGLTGSPITFTATAAAVIAKTSGSSGDNQTGVQGTQLSLPLSVTVTNGSGSPVAGIAVAWAVASGAGSVSGASSTTNGSGVATIRANLGAAGGVNTYTATVAGLTGSPLTFSALAAKVLAKSATANGDNQTGVQNTQLALPLSVTVTDNASGPVAGITVTWAVASGGGSVTGASSVTDASGLATMTVKLGTTGGANSYSATVSGLTPASVTFNATAAKVLAKSATANGDNQTGVQGAALGLPLSVTVTDNASGPVAGITVSWAAASGGGSVTAGSSVTDASGLATMTATLGATGGSNTYTATVAGLTPSFVTFSASAAKVLAKSASSNGDNQTGVQGTQLATPLSVTVTNGSGGAVAGITVNWAAATGGGSVGSATSVTNGSGIATSTATLGASGGANTYTASVAGLTPSSVTFSATAAKVIAKNGGDTQTGVQGTQLTTPLNVLVTDGSSNPVSGITVNWAVASGNGSVGAATSTTNGSGVATVTATLGAAGGANSYTATVAGLTGSVLTFTATAAKNLAKSATANGDAQTGVQGTQLALPLSVTVTDNASGPVAGITVTWAAASGGGSVGSATSVTNASGIATTTATLGSTGGANSYTATVAGLTGSAQTFTATAAKNLAKSATANGDNQTGVQNAQLALPLSVTVTDNASGAVAGIVVTWAVASGGGSVTSATSTTDGSGIATMTVKLGTSGGANSYTATVTGLTPSFVTFNASAARVLAKSATLNGDNQTGVQGTTLAVPLSVTVTNGSAGAVAGITVNWAMATGGGSVSAATSVTNASGIATINATLGSAGGANTYTATVAGLTPSSVTFSATAASVLAKSATSNGDNQTGVQNTTLASALSVTVTDGSSNPVAGIAVAWGVSAGGGSVTSGSSSTDSSGIATMTVKLGTGGGLNTYTATVTGLTPSFVTFNATAAKAIAKAPSANGDNQTGVQGTQLANPLVVKVTDGSGGAVAGITVSWATSTGGSVGSPTAVTDASGLAQTTATLNTTGGTNTYTASVATLTGSPISFSATAAKNIAKAASANGDNQTGVAGAQLALPLVVKVTDNAAGAVAGITVTWATSTGGSVGSATSQTDASGLAQTTATLNSTGGTNTYTATVSGLTGSAVSFNAIAAKNVAVNSGDAQSGVAGVQLTNPLVVKVTDNGTNPVAGITVTFASGSGGSVGTASAVTDAGGLAQSTATLGAAGGAQTFTGTVAGLTPATFTATAATSVAKAATNNGDNQSGSSGQALATAFAVLVTTNGTTPVQGITVHWAPGAGGGSIASTSVTNSSGLASATGTLGNATGAQTFTANVTGIATTITFNATLLPPSFGSGVLTFTPNVILGGTTPASALHFSLPALSSGSASSVDLTVTPAGGSASAVSKSAGGGFAAGDLGNGSPIAVDAPTTSNSAPGTTYQYSLTATNPGGTSSAATATLNVYLPKSNTAFKRVGSTATLLTSGPNTGKVLIVGGGDSLASGLCTYNASSNTAELYDPATGALSSAGSTNQNRCQHTAVISGTKVYVMGGANSSTASDNLRVDVYDMAAGTWLGSGFPTINANRRAHVAALIPSGTNINRIILAGGYAAASGGSANAGLTSIELFDPTAGTSTTYSHSTGSVPSVLSAKRGEPAGVLSGNFLYVIGGTDAGNGTDDGIDAIDITKAASGSTGQVNKTTANAVTGSPIARYASAALALSTTSILVVGGINGSGNPTANMQLYTVSSSNGDWTAVSTAVNLTTARARFTLLPAGPANKYLAFGGVITEGSPDTATTSVELITNSSGTLSTASGGTLQQAHQDSGVVNLNVSGASNSVFLLGGGGASATGGAELLIGP